MSIEKQIAKYEARLKELREKSEKSEDVAELRAINAEMVVCREALDSLRSARDELREAQKTDNKDAGTDANPDDKMKDKNADDKKNDDEPVDDRTAVVNKMAEQRSRVLPHGAASTATTRTAAQHKDYEERGAALKQRGNAVRFDSNCLFHAEKRSVLTTTPTIVVPTFDSPVVNEGFNVVSSLIDRVKHVNLAGGESYEEPYGVDIPDGTYTAEGSAAADTDVKFGKAAMAKTKITAYSEISREMLKLPNADYAGYVQDAIRTSIRAKMTKEILLGTGATNSFVGIFSDKATAIDPDTDLALATIDDTTLDQIIFNYGGKEDVEDAAVLILNKLDLLAFASVRTSTKQKFYDIRSQGNTGTINGIPYIINSACSQLTDTTKKTGDYCMAYGSLSNYTVATFADIEVAQSDQYKFKEGMICNRGDVYAGGNVTRYNGFLRIKRKATA